METPFKLKSGNASAFKNLGSSPAKQGGNNLKRIMAENKATAKTAGTFYPPPADFNVKGDPTKTPGHSTTKAAKNINRPTWDRSGGIKIGDHHKVTKGPEAIKPPKKAIVTKTTPTGTKTNVGPSDRYGNKSATGKTKFIKQSGGRKVTKGGGHYSPKSVLDGANKSKSKVSKVVNLVKSKGKEILKHPTTRKVLKVIKRVSKINPALGIMPAPFINPIGESYNKNQEG